ncbi:MAG: C40 family peptidase [Bacteroidia bacterium]|nr:C40 family peptidase [Bacteroidia bacterium]
MISQLIFGDFAYHQDQKDSWTYIKCEYDSYEGWVDSKMLTEIPEDFDTSLLVWKWIKQASIVFGDSPYSMSLPIGARVPYLANEIWTPNGQKVDLQDGSVFFEKAEQQILPSIAFTFMHTPYLWGGSSSFGIDCSGFTQRIYRINGRYLPRDSRDQEGLGNRVNFEESRAGDLAFFSKPMREKVTHVGLIIDNDRIIHASGRVRIDKLTSTGIIHSEEHKLTHELISIKR